MLVQQVDAIGPEPTQLGFDDLPYVLRTAVEPTPLARQRDLEPELGGDDDVVPDRRQRLADHFLAQEGPVHLGGVEEGDAALGGGPRRAITSRGSTCSSAPERWPACRSPPIWTTSSAA